MGGWIEDSRESRAERSGVSVSRKGLLSQAVQLTALWEELPGRNIQRREQFSVGRIGWTDDREDQENRGIGMTGRIKTIKIMR